MDFKEAQAHLEAVLFANAEPLTATSLADILAIEAVLVERMLLQLRDDCERESRGVQLLRLESGWQFATKQSSAEYVKKTLDRRRNTPLTPAALEVLAIIAYNQPVSRSFIEHVRGVDSSSVVASLVEKELIVEAGRLDLPGRPIAFKTTDAFLRAFGIASLGELPALHTEAPEGTAEDESGLYRHSDGEEPVALAEEEEVTRAVRGGAFIEGVGGAAELIEDD